MGGGLISYTICTRIIALKVMSSIHREQCWNVFMPNTPLDRLVINAQVSWGPTAQFREEIAEIFTSKG